MIQFIKYSNKLSQVTVNKLYSWNIKIWNTLLSQVNSLPHAMLFLGPAGTGKGQFAEYLAARLLCESAQREQLACGKCEGCHLLATGNHPDIRLIALEDETDEQSDDDTPSKTASKSKKKPPTPTTQIKIGQIRELEDFVFVGSHRQGRRVVIIDPADAMNIAATNALLKILEEPPASVCFILVSSNSKRLLPTVRSRCRQMVFGIPEVTIARDWLKSEGVKNPENVLSLAGGAPPRALAIHQEGTVELLDDILKPLHRQPLELINLAAHWDGLRKKYPAFLLEHLVDALQKWVYDLTRVRSGSSPRYLLGLQKELVIAAPKTSVQRLNRAYADLLRIRATVRHPLNELLFLEDLAARCAIALSPTKS